MVILSREKMNIPGDEKYAASTIFAHESATAV
jgi:hypothetical protein